MGSLVAGQIRSTSTLNPHTPEVEGRGWAQGRESRRLEVKGQAGARGRASWSKLVVEARGWGSRSRVDDEAWPVWRYRNCLIEGACCAIQVPNTKSQTKNPRYIHRTKQYSYMFKMSGGTTLENPLTREKCYSQISIMHVYTEHQENAISNHFGRSSEHNENFRERGRIDH